MDSIFISRLPIIDRTNTPCVCFQWIPPPVPEKQRDADEQISIDLGDEYEQALTDASQEEIIDLAGEALY